MGRAQVEGDFRGSLVSWGRAGRFVVRGRVPYVLIAIRFEKRAVILGAWARIFEIFGRVTGDWLADRQIAPSRAVWTGQAASLD